MSAPTRGHCLIINNRHFEEPTAADQKELSDRDGSEMDAKNISNVFKRLSFVCDKIHEDLPAQASNCKIRCYSRISSLC